MAWVNAIIQGVLIGGLYALFACGLSLMFGVMKVVNLAHGDLAVVAGYIAIGVITVTHIPVLWSFLMATAHGAGLMAVPVLLKLPLCDVPGVPLDANATIVATLGASLWTGFAAILVHSAAMLVVAGAIAWVVLQSLGLAFLRRGWINLDLVWSSALIGVGAVFLAVIGVNMARAGPWL